MRSFANPLEAREAIADYLIASVPERLQPRWRQLRSAIGVDQIVGLGEFIYANREELDNDAKELGAGLIAFATFPNAWHDLAVDGRGDKIVLALRRDTGEKPPTGVKFPKPAEDPQPLQRHVVEDASQPATPEASA